MSDSLPAAHNAEGRADVGGLSLPTAAAQPSGAEGEAGAHRPPAGPPLSILSEPGPGRAESAAGGGRSVRCPSQLPRGGRAGSRPAGLSPPLLPELSPSVEAVSAGSCGAHTPSTGTRGRARRVLGRRPERGERAGLRCSGRERRRRP